MSPDAVRRTPSTTGASTHPAVCGFVPYPTSYAYGDWSCQRRRWHLGRHRYRNYTIGRIPRVWRLRALVRDRRTDRRLRAMSGNGPTLGYGYRRTLFPAKFEPIKRSHDEAMALLERT